MSSQPPPPPPPLVSPDGRNYWDGQSWLPIQQQQITLTGPFETTPDGRFYWDGARWMPTHQPPMLVQERSEGVPFATGSSCSAIVWIAVVLVVALLVTGVRSLIATRR